MLHEREYWRELGDRGCCAARAIGQAGFAEMALVTDSLFGLFKQPDSRIQALRGWGLRGFDKLAPSNNGDPAGDGPCPTA